MHDHAVGEVVVRALDLEVEPVHPGLILLHVDVEATRAGTVELGLDELGTTANWPRNRSSSLCSIEGCTYGAISSWSLAVSSFGKTRSAVSSAAAPDERGVQFEGAGQMLHEPLP